MARVTIECETDIDINDYVDDIDLDVLLDEVMRRIPKNNRERAKKMQMFKEIDFEVSDLVELISQAKGLSLIQSMNLEEFIKEL